MSRLDWSNYTVLIVEDDPMSFKYLDLVLSKKTNINILWATNGQQAIDFIKGYSYIDLILMDLQLPLVNGFEAIKRIRSIKPGMPVIVQSANSFNEERERCMCLGCEAYFTKPVNSTLLISSMERILSQMIPRTT